MREAQFFGEEFPLGARGSSSRWPRAAGSARRCRSRARNTVSPRALQPAASSIAARSASRPAPVFGHTLSTLADAYDVKLPRELVLIGKQFLYVERYMKLLAPKWQMM